MKTMKYIILFVVVFVSSFVMAESCKNGMAKFSKISNSKTKSICDFFKDEPSFMEFKGCVFSTVKKFNRTASDADIYEIPEEDLNGIISLCGAPSETVIRINNDKKQSQQNKQ